jgi:hypothetical protein
MLNGVKRLILTAVCNGFPGDRYPMSIMKKKKEMTSTSVNGYAHNLFTESNRRRTIFYEIYCYKYSPKDSSRRLM